MKVIDSDSFNIISTQPTQILIVEDEYVIAANLQENLEAFGYSVLGIASSAAEAIEAAQVLRPDLVLMDIQLQGQIDGIQAAEQIWYQLQIPIIYVTGHSDKGTLERAKVTFPFGYILKPIKGRELYVAIETALNRYEREQLIATVIKSMGDGIIVVNTQGQILFINAAAELITGWQQAEARNRDLLEVFNVVYEDTRLPIANVAIAAVQQDTVIFLTEQVVLITKQGTFIPITDSVAPIKNHKGLITGAVLVFRDDTQRQLRRDQDQIVAYTEVLQRQRTELQRLNQLKDDFLSTASHELRSPLSNIRMAVQMLEITLEQQGRLNPDSVVTSEQLTRYITILREQCNQQLSLVNDLLELQQLEADAYPVEWVDIQINEWITQEIATFQERARSREQHLQAIIADDFPAFISDLKFLTRILTELLTNACKYTPPKGAITVAVGARRPEDDASAQQNEQTSQIARSPIVQIKVCNSGVEISAHELTRIFDKFYRIPMSDRWKQGGTGLGLALVKKLTTYLGGTVWAESSAGQTCFIVELPIAPVSCAN